MYDVGPVAGTWALALAVASDALLWNGRREICPLRVRGRRVYGLLVAAVLVLIGGPQGWHRGSAGVPLAVVPLVLAGVQTWRWRRNAAVLHQ